jgi:hypothetical protein
MENLELTKTVSQKNNSGETKSYVKYDYSFELKINNDMICQRYFNINRFNPNSLKSIEFKNYFDSICNMIEEDLKSKTRVYLYNVCSTFAREADLKRIQEMNIHQISIADICIDIDIALYSSELYTPLYDEFHPDYINQEVNDISFSFLYKDKVFMTRVWNGNDYPQFIRKNIDIANHQWIQINPQYRVYFDNCDEDKLKYEQTLKKKIFQGREDLIPKIITMFREVCSMENRDYEYYY